MAPHTKKRKNYAAYSFFGEVSVRRIFNGAKVSFRFSFCPFFLDEQIDITSQFTCENGFALTIGIDGEIVFFNTCTRREIRLFSWLSLNKRISALPKSFSSVTNNSEKTAPFNSAKSATNDSDTHTAPPRILCSMDSSLSFHTSPV